VGYDVTLRQARLQGKVDSAGGLVLCWAVLDYVEWISCSLRVVGACVPCTAVICPVKPYLY
jgi:hypothetical protein